MPTPNMKLQHGLLMMVIGVEDNHNFRYVLQQEIQLLIENDNPSFHSHQISKNNRQEI